MTVPFIVIFALLIGNAQNGGRGSGSSSPSQAQVLPRVTVIPPPSHASADTPCSKVIGPLPLRLDGLSVRDTATNPASPFVVAWGNPAIVLRCGVNRPKALTRTAQLILVNRVNFVAVHTSTQTVWTVVDRVVYIDVTVPSSYSQPPLGPIADVIAKNLPAVCGNSADPGAHYCADRK